MVSEVGYEPTPTFVDQDALFGQGIETLNLAGLALDGRLASVSSSQLYEAAHMLLRSAVFEMALLRPECFFKVSGT